MAKPPPTNAQGMIEGTGDVSPGGAYRLQQLKGVMLFGDSIEIDLSKPLKAYGNQYVMAYQARSRAGDGRSYIAYVCEPAFTPRNRMGPAYAAVSNPSLVRLVGSGIGRIPDQHLNRFVFVYEDTLGKPLSDTDTDLALGMKPDRVLEKVFVPLLDVLRDLRNGDIVHGGIRVTNLFDGGKENYDHVVLGECLSLPSSMAQPAVYEPVDRAMAQPTGRGAGSNQDDMYSLGVSLALLMRAKDPMRGKNDAEILQSKMQYGSFTTLMSSEDHLPNSVTELLRGLLHDDRRQRWTIEDTLAWHDGRRLSPKQGIKRLRASRPLDFAGKTYSFPTSLARDMFRHPTEAAQLIDSGEIQQWLKRSLDDEAMFDRFEMAIRLGDDDPRRGPMYFDRLIARVGICMDPDGPVRFRDVSVTGEGLATALAEAFVSGRNLQTYAEIFSGNLLSYWLTVLTDLNIDVVSFVSRFDACRGFMRQQGPGFGLERVLYYLNPDVHCLSPLVNRYYVRTPEELLQALDDLAADKANRPARIVDRHILAFLCVRDRKMAEPYIYDLSSEELFRHALGTLQSLAAIQRFGKVAPVKNLSNWMADFIEPVFARFHDRDTRKDLRKKVEELRDKGDLPRLLAVLDDAELLRRDLSNFRRAMQMHKALVTEKNNLLVRTAQPKYFGRREGREAAIAASGIISMLLLIGVIVLYLNGARIL